MAGSKIYSDNKGGITSMTARRRKQKFTVGDSLSIRIIYGILCSMLAYVLVVVFFTRSLSSSSNLYMGTRPEDYTSAADPSRNGNKKNPNYVPRKYTREEWGDRKINVHKAGENPEDRVQPQLREQSGREALVEPKDPAQKHGDRPVLTAYLEPIDRDKWNKKPLPRRTAKSTDLKVVTFQKLDSCSRLPEQWPIDDYPQEDPFLPWIHDVFPTHDGKFVQFIAQNKRRCRTGTTTQDMQVLAQTEPQVALFQHVAVQRVNQTSHELGGTTAPRYRLVDHEHADPDGMETRFICRFQPSGEETLSIYNFNYEWASFRKRIKQMFTPDGRDNKQIHTSQLTFLCPVPEALVETIRTGASVRDDYATLFIDLIPIRTPPRYGPPSAFFPPYYQEFQANRAESFNANVEWGADHILPLVEDSGRWANIPICKPSLLTYGKQSSDVQALALPNSQKSRDKETMPVKQHNLVSCLWASSGYSTRGNRFAINDGRRRLLEWITYHKLIGVDHFYLYDNSGAFGMDDSYSLQSVAELFPDDVTVINWPCQVCNNNPNNVDSVGERSSQYAAEASCRLRFGPHVNWIAQFDIDEYLVPMGNNTSILPLLDTLDHEGKKIISFGSWRAWPRRKFIETPVRLHGIQDCGRDHDCFQLKIPLNHTMLQAYNCDRQKPGEKVDRMPAEKQIYRPDYVKHHFVHYSTVTGLSILNKDDVLKRGYKWIPGSAFPDPLSRFADEKNEALMLHSKAVATQDTVFWETACKADYDGPLFCRLGTPFPEDNAAVNTAQGDEGWKFNCYVNHKIEDYWVPLLEKKLKAHVPELASRMEHHTNIK